MNVFLIYSIIYLFFLEVTKQDDFNILNKTLTSSRNKVLYNKYIVISSLFNKDSFLKGNFSPRVVLYTVFHHFYNIFRIKNVIVTSKIYFVIPTAKKVNLNFICTLNSTTFVLCSYQCQTKYNRIKFFSVILFS